MVPQFFVLNVNYLPIDFISDTDLNDDGGCKRHVDFGARKNSS